MVLKKNGIIWSTLLLFVLFISCDSQNTVSFEQDDSATPPSTAYKAKKPAKAESGQTGGWDEGVVSSELAALNDELAERGMQVALHYAETITSADQIGQTLFANDRTKTLQAQWVPGDSRRAADGNNLTYLVYEPLSTATGPGGAVDSEPEIDASFATWNSFKKHKLNIVKRPDTGIFPSLIFGGDPFVADIVELGFLPGSVFDAVLGPGASTTVLGVTFTFVFIDANGNPTDIDNDGYADVALKEVWYNDDFSWTNTGSGAYDIQTVALHENGHALGFGHFGRIFITNANGKAHFAPRAVMNALYAGAQRTLLGTDKASFNNVYGDWPKD